MAIDYREHLTSLRELREMAIADVILIIAFDLALTGGVPGLRSGAGIADFLYLLPITAIAVTLSFALHETMHKLVAQRFGAIAGFVRSQMGTLITIVTAMLGFLVGIPGATVIYTNTFTKREEGIVSLAGPLTNFAVFVVFFTAGILVYHGFVHSISMLLSQGQLASSYIQNILIFTVFISILLAFFNMLPIPPLDGSKILRWNKYAYAALVLAIFVLFLTIVPIGTLVYYLFFWLVIAFLISLFYRGVGLF